MVLSLSAIFVKPTERRKEPSRHMDRKKNTTSFLIAFHWPVCKGASFWSPILGFCPTFWDQILLKGVVVVILTNQRVKKKLGFSLFLIHTVSLRSPSPLNSTEGKEPRNGPRWPCRWTPGEWHTQKQLRGRVVKNVRVRKYKGKTTWMASREAVDRRSKEKGRTPNELASKNVQ